VRCIFIRTTLAGRLHLSWLWQAARGVLKSRPRLYECLDCGRQTSITAGTAMHRTKLPLTAWFWAAHLMATHSDGIWA
jgi:hypothetical protein